MFNKAYWIFLSRGGGGGYFQFWNLTLFERGYFWGEEDLSIRNGLLDVRLIPNNNIPSFMCWIFLSREGGGAYFQFWNLTLFERGLFEGEEDLSIRNGLLDVRLIPFYVLDISFEGRGWGLLSILKFDLELFERGYLRGGVSISKKWTCRCEAHSKSSYC